MKVHSSIPGSIALERHFWWQGWCILFIAMIGAHSLEAQYTGINTTAPERSLHVKGVDNQFLRIETMNGASATGVEFVNWSFISSMDDWRISNFNGDLNIERSTNNFESGNETILHITEDGKMGIQSDNVLSPLHVGASDEASNNQNGALTIGNTSGINMALDGNEINARLNGSDYMLRFQQEGGLTNIGNGGGNVYIGSGGGSLGIGMTSVPARLSLDGTNFHLALRNPSNSMNDWFIGASNADWAISDNQLVFSPESSSSSSSLRLRAVSENNGTQAPVLIKSAGGQGLLMDGNEIDGLQPLFINHNSDQNTYINPTGGNVGIGAASASSTLTVETVPTEYALRLENGAAGTAWDIHPFPAIDKLAFIKEGVSLAYVDGVSGDWIALSDRNFKENIEPMANVLDKVRQMGIYQYQFKHDETNKAQMGPLAQDIVKYFPEIVNQDGDQYLVSYSKLAVIALKALQEQQGVIEQLTMEVESLVKSHK